MTQKHFQYVVCLNMEDIKDKMIEDQKISCLVTTLKITNKCLWTHRHHFCFSFSFTYLKPFIIWSVAEEDMCALL